MWGRSDYSRVGAQMADTHDSEVSLDAGLVARLVAAQFPQWAQLQVKRVTNDGWDNWTFHLGERMKVRLPSAERYVAQVEKEHTWLPRLAPHLPLPIPVPLGIGAPGEGYPFPWSIYGWIKGETAAPGRIADLPLFAADVARFLRALQRIDATGGPPPGAHSFFRGGDLRVYDAETRECIAALGDRIDRNAATATWEAALAAEWRGAPVWVHGDIAVGNLLVEEGQLSAVIDFGSSAVGDPACDLALAWVFLDGEAREAFRRAIDADAAIWARARGWTLWKALLVHSRGQRMSPAEHPVEQIIADVIAEHAAS
jgi:aminoglycoside phosphotransferase (APT) family kinase protein